MSRVDDLKDRLKELDDVIRRVEQGGQEIQFNGRKIRMADLSILNSRRKEIQNELDRLTGGHGGRIGVAVWTNR